MVHQIVNYCNAALPLIEKNENDLETKIFFFGLYLEGKVVGGLLKNKHFRHLIKEVLLWDEISSDAALAGKKDKLVDEKMRELTASINDYLSTVLVNH